MRRGGGKRGAAVFGKGELHRGLILRSAEPDQGGSRAVGIKMRTVHGTCFDMPSIWMGDARLKPSAPILNQEMSRIFSGVWPR